MLNIFIARAEATIGKPYTLFAQNCERFASFAFTGLVNDVREGRES
jgi:hypothetical protein